MGLRDEVQTLLGSQSREYWISLFDGVDCCFTPVLSLEETMVHPLFVERSMVKTDKDGKTWIQSPVQFT